MPMIATEKRKLWLPVEELAKETPMNPNSNSTHSEISYCSMFNLRAQSLCSSQQRMAGLRLD